MQRSRWKYVLYALSGGIGASLAYQAYTWIWQAPICPNYDKTQRISLDHVLACTAWIPNPNQFCSGAMTMRKIGAATGVNFKLIPKEFRGKALFGRHQSQRKADRITQLIRQNLHGRLRVHLG